MQPVPASEAALPAARWLRVQAPVPKALQALQQALQATRLQARLQPPRLGQAARPPAAPALLQGQTGAHRKKDKTRLAAAKSGRRHH